MQVAAWKARGVVPALLEVTADIVSCLVHEEDCAKYWDFSGHVLRLQYAMALTRCVVVSNMLLCKFGWSVSQCLSV